ncbi:MAG: glycosyltransferase family 2 protein [Ornithinimicrobium sp.]
MADPAESGVVAVIAAKDEAQRIAATVRSLASGVSYIAAIVVVDDGSRDLTSTIAREQGAHVERHRSNRGKAAAMATGARVAKVMHPDAAVLFVDADLEESAAALGVLCLPVMRGEADMTIAVLPPQRAAGGGFGLVTGLAAKGIEDLTGWRPSQPLSGMRCVRRSTLDDALPLARGWGVEVGLTVDVLRGGGRVHEVPCELHHRVTGKDWRSQLHRARQYRDVWIALARRRRPLLRRRP